MTITNRLACAALGTLFLALAGPASAQNAADPTGLWLTETGDSKVRIARCGAGYCGTLASVSGPGLDSQNPDASLKNRKLVGVQIMNANRPKGDGFEGTLYNPKDGKTYAGSMTLKGANVVEVAGCVMSVFCKTQTWKRVN
ncbi:hypothetical protein PMNALOAF_2624 [Methylobacterium adhaesivum]|jgi:uncharacterized protein (DUF2147 family)|uniref:DUF2147 domain-containing protein n=1 Tax=Methylobacterium adhaesivum TaxID=333297 RepID=A0ABT8BEJ6_9HYPH|nr:DUF2147 domain-containing protein [Methylobacterium adhaesivum]MDN3590547.1 DUF2147 domain-containing protein [Methylobacterium adhaesivum]GJD31369.1 hypothetical protein PMNALOAF_2624 [Methylobacterium adhaesivum]